jgi:nucleoid DNA-binding protein
VNKSGLVDEVKNTLDVSRSRAKDLVEVVLEEMRNAVAEGQSLSLRGLGFTPDKQLVETRAKAPDRPEVATGTEPTVVPYDPPRNPDADAVAAAAAELSRPPQPQEPIDLRIVPTMPEPELIAEPAALAYSSGDADTDESIGDLIARNE